MEKSGWMPLSIRSINFATHLLSNGRSIRKNQSAERFRYMEVRNRCAGGPPGRIKPWLRRPFHSVKIDAPRGFGIKTLDKTSHRYSQLRDPSFGGFVYDHAPPQSALQVVLFSQSDVQIDPKSIRADFELFIAAHIRRIGLQKYFGDIAVPQPVTAAVRLSIRKYGNDAISR
jgi:hypothetical protein